MMANYEAITAQLPSEFAMELTWFAGGCSVERLEAAKVFFSEPSHAPPGTAKELEKVADEVMRCVRLNEQEGRSVTEYLNQFAKKK